MLYPKSVTTLIDSFTKLPGVGAKSAERMAFHIINNFQSEDIEDFTSCLKDVKNTLRPCKKCGFITDSEYCVICESDLRDQSTIMVIEQNKDLVAIEKSGQFSGLYHVLGGAISPMKGLGPDDLTIETLIKRVDDENIEELIIATNPKVEGEATALYISKLLSAKNVRITKLAHGLSIGTELEYADQLTLMRALEGRKSF